MPRRVPLKRSGRSPKLTNENVVGGQAGNARHQDGGAVRQADDRAGRRGGDLRRDRSSGLTRVAGEGQVVGSSLEVGDDGLTATIDRAEHEQVVASAAVHSGGGLTGDQGVVAGAASQERGPGGGAVTDEEHPIGAAANEGGIARATENGVSAVGHPDNGIARTSRDHTRTAGSDNRRGAGAQSNRVGAAAGNDGVVPADQNGVGAAGQTDNVRARAGSNGVGASRSDDGVIARATEDRGSGGASTSRGGTQQLTAVTTNDGLASARTGLKNGTRVVVANDKNVRRRGTDDGGRGRVGNDHGAVSRTSGQEATTSNLLRGAGQLAGVHERGVLQHGLSVRRGNARDGRYSASNSCSHISTPPRRDRIHESKKTQHSFSVVDSTSGLILQDLHQSTFEPKSCFGKREWDER